MGAMVFGRVQQERIALNESSFWFGQPHDYDNPEANKYFAQIRDLAFAGKFQEAEKAEFSLKAGQTIRLNGELAASILQEPRL